VKTKSGATRRALALANVVLRSGGLISLSIRAQNNLRRLYTTGQTLILTAFSIQYASFARLFPNKFIQPVCIGSVGS
jgi:hypothetical protein